MQADTLEREVAVDPADAPALLEVAGLSVHFGGIAALEDVSFNVPRGSVYGVIGPNGAGKTTLFNSLSRLNTPAAGDIRLEGASLLGARAHDIAALGIGRTFQNVALFRALTVLDNVKIGGHSGTRADFHHCAFRLPWTAREEQGLEARAMTLLKKFDLDRYARRPCGELPFGIQKRVELARAMASAPKLLLLDEPAAGLSHEELQALKDMVRAIRGETGTTVMLVEHNVAMVMSLCDRIVTLNFGRRIAEGTPQQVRNDPAVITAYLGTGHT